MAHAEIGVRHVRGDLLVARRDKLDAVARGVKRIEHADIAMPANAEDIGNIVGDQIFGDQLGALHPWHSVLLCRPFCTIQIGLLAVILPVQTAEDDEKQFHCRVRAARYRYLRRSRRAHSSRNVLGLTF